MLIRILYQKPEILGIPEKITSRNIILSIVKTIDSKTKISLNYISQQMKTMFIPYSIPKTKETEEFLEQIVKMFPNTKKELFFKKKRFYIPNRSYNRNENNFYQNRII
jgi:hypothetical protein